jgi:hypothetical protein
MHIGETEASCFAILLFSGGNIWEQLFEKHHFKELK